METESAIKLVKELKTNKLLPKYNEALLNDVIKDVNDVYAKITDPTLK